jgi:hypothetical protein
MTLHDEVTCDRLINTFMDQEKSKGCNNYMFEDPAPEMQLLKTKSQVQTVSKNKLLKFQAVFNISQCPGNITTDDIT